MAQSAMRLTHRPFNSTLAANYLTAVWKFINMLKQKQGLQEAKTEQQTADALQKKRKKGESIKIWTSG